MRTTATIAALSAGLLLVAWLRIDALSGNLDACRADNRLTQQLHADTTGQLAEASQLLADQVQRIAVDEQALADALVERDRIEKERNWAWYENSKLLDRAYTGSCAEYAETLMCKEVLDQWKDEYKQLQQLLRR